MLSMVTTMTMPLSARTTSTSKAKKPHWRTAGSAYAALHRVRGEQSTPDIASQPVAAIAPQRESREGSQRGFWRYAALEGSRRQEETRRIKGCGLQAGKRLHFELLVAVGIIPTIVRVELPNMNESNELRARAGRRIQERRTRERRLAESEFRARGFEGRLMHDRRIEKRRVK